LQEHKSNRALSTDERTTESKVKQESEERMIIDSDIEHGQRKQIHRPKENGNEKTLKCGHGEEYRNSVRPNTRHIKKLWKVFEKKEL